VNSNDSPVPTAARGRLFPKIASQASQRSRQHDLTFFSPEQLFCEIFVRNAALRRTEGNELPFISLFLQEQI
jgi:hypothetical protein